jgi:hypothetical protein
MARVFRWWAIFFGCLQLTGLASMCIWPFAKAAGPFLWGTAFITLFPGNLAAAVLIEGLFWNKGLSLRAMSIAEIPLLVAFNAVLWLVVVGALRWLVGQLKGISRTDQ